MSAIANIANSFLIAPGSGGPSALKPPAATPHHDTPEGDRVEISSVGRSLSRGVEPSSFQRARVQAIRAEIAAGSYETPERISGTVDRLLDVVG